MSNTKKDTVYVDIDDEITGIIDKVNSSKSKIVALVLPKRATALHSIVNMKLLHRTAKETTKKVVLITSESSVSALAGAVGVYTAKTLQSQPKIPDPPMVGDKTYHEAKQHSQDIEDVELDTAAAIGKLAGLSMDKPKDDQKHQETKKHKPNKDDKDDKDVDETLEIDNSETSDEDKPKAKKPKKDKKLRVPNFNKFRLRLFGGGAILIALIVLWYFAASVWPKATIVIKTDTSTVSALANFVAKTDVTEVDEANDIIPATIDTVEKTDEETVSATGQKDVGNKASGTVTFVNCSKDDKLSDKIRTVPAGTGISSGNFTFITATSVEVEPSSFLGNTCLKNKISASVKVTAQNGGDAYNLDSRTYSVSGLSNMTGSGSDMIGGTSQIVKVISQTDIDTAKDKLANKIENSAKTELQAKLEQAGQYALTSTFAKGESVITTDVEVNAEAAEVKVTAVTKYTMIGVLPDHLKQLLAKNAETNIDTGKQSILEDGFEFAVVRISESLPTGEVRGTAQTVMVVGPNINEEQIKQAVAGTKRGVTESTIGELPGVTDVIVEYGPFWVFSTPKDVTKITIIIEQTNTDDNNTQDNNQ